MSVPIGTALGALITNFITGKADKLLAKNSISKDYRSISKQATQGVCQFPVIMSRSLDYETMMLVSKACERTFCSFLQVVLQMNQVLGEDESVVDFISRFHTNAGEIDSRYEQLIIPELLKENSFLLKTPKELFRVEKGVNSLYSPIINPKKLYLMENSSVDDDDDTDESDNIVSGVDSGHSEDNHTMRHSSTADERKHYSLIKGDMVPKDVLLDNDIKKSNEMVPSLLHVKVKQNLSTGGITAVDFVLGVKSNIHPVTSSDMINNITKVANKKTDFFKFLQWTTGEISLFKDIILGLKDVKTNLRDEFDQKSSVWWNILRDSKLQRRYKKWSRQNPMLPNATLVISQEEADYLKATIKYDLLDSYTAKQFIRELGLIQFIVVDTASEVVHIFIDGQKHFNVYTFSAIERENGNSEKQFKNILKAVNKL